MAPQNGMSLLRLGYKKAGFHLAPSFSLSCSVVLKKASGYAISSQCCGEAHVAKNRERSLVSSL